ncbi:MAG: SOS response-associated peptidase [Oscillospiraceae bacterium]|nr:SOS response-associated peptidase [Oscillospiraceae bacterium]
MRTAPYYEWETLPDKKKVKYIFTNPDKHGIFMAGIQKLAQEQDEFVIITKPAESEIRFIHERMPLIIGAEQAADWLSGRLSVGKAVGCKSGIVWEKAEAG